MDLPETWRPIEGFEDLYEVSSIGRVRSIKRRRGSPARVRKTNISTNGYRAISLYRNCIGHARRVHQMVAGAFIGPCPDGQHVRHLDGDSLNNCAPNLGYGTRSDNMLDSVRHGTHYTASRTHCPNGHPYDEQNTIKYDNRRYCRACTYRRNTEIRQRKRNPT